MTSMMRFRISLPLLCFAILFGSEQIWLHAQDTDVDVDSESAIPVNAGVARLDAASRRITASLESRERYRVTVNEKWVLDGNAESSGVNQFRLSVWHGGAFDLSVGSEGGSSQSLQCRSDGENLTRILYRPAGGTIYSQQPGSLIHVLDDVMTETSLRNSGLDLLFRELPDQYLMSMASDVAYVGSEELAGVRADHFRFSWGGDPSNQKDVWLALGEAPRLLRVVSTVEFAAGQNVRHELRVESDLQWEPEAQVPEKPAPVEIPADAKRVSDLYGYLLEGATSELIGHAAPLLPLELLDGSKWDLSRHREKEFVVVYFFASWAAPSHSEMPVILKFIESFGPKGVAFYAVNVGEEPSIVKAFAESQGYSQPVVIDTKRQAAAAFGVTSLPAVVLIGKDGMINSAHVGNTPEVRALVRQELEKLLGIKSDAE